MSWLIYNTVQPATASISEKDPNLLPSRSKYTPEDVVRDGIFVT